ncbi:hypothetical protein AMJ49_05720 [Parcubacteria bacterium DG_74_2]|nr:MAG: hypothetical protein AMJ49_05720 [Parcubacteria bacterium DG_74_2]
MIWPTKKLGEISVGIIFIAFAIVLFIKEEYGFGTTLILALLILLKIDSLTDFAFSLTDGLQTRFKTPVEKIEEDIKENRQPITRQNFARFQNVETKILAELQKRYGGKMKTLIHFMYGQPDKPEFRYTPDGSLQTDDRLYFFEIKYVLKQEFAESIVKNTLKYLSEVYSKLLPSIGDKKFVIKLILVSAYDLSYMSFDTPKGIEIEFYKI